MKISILHKSSKTILTKASGFLHGYSHTLNPYGGCAFACKYCYVRQMPVSLFRGAEWGSWVDVKENAAQLLPKEIVKAKKKGAVTIFMSSATDPYQPVEAREQLTRSLLHAMLIEPPDFLFLQTRSPLVIRDLDLLKSFGHRIRVSITVETDREDVRKRFAPFAPPIQGRLRALSILTGEGIPTQAAVSPVLPFSSQFAKKLRKVTNRICIDTYQLGDGSGGKRSERLGIREIYGQDEVDQWYNTDLHQHVLEWMKTEFALEQIFLSQQGFLPDK
jgi:DNA repair photolyase